MQAIRATQALNKAELENATPPNASWHRDYKDTAYVYIGGLPLDLSEGDVVTIFSQYGHPTHLNLIRDKESGKSKGFAFLKYEDQRSCDLAVDNLGGAKIFDRMLRVDHTRYKKRDDEDEETYRIDKHVDEINENGKRSSDIEADSDEEKTRRKKPRKMLKSEKELEEMLAVKENGEEQDPMREYLIRQKREEVAADKEREERREKKAKHRHRHRHRDGDGDDGENDGSRRHRSSRHDDDDDEKDGRDRQGHSRRGKNGGVEGQSRDDRDRDRDRRRRDDSNEERRSKRRQRSRSRDGQDTRHEGGSSHRSDRKRGDGSRERARISDRDRKGEHNRDRDREERHRRREENDDDSRRGRSSRDGRRGHAGDAD